MVIGIIHKGSGCGDQLFSYIITRVIALDRGFDFGFVGKEFFKGTFLDLDWGKETEPQYEIEPNSGAIKLIGSYKEFGINKPNYDPEVNFIEDGTVIDGYGAQDEKYWTHRLPEIQKWLSPKGQVTFDEGEYNCVINFRGGEFAAIPDLFLPQSYWDEAIAMKKAQGVKTFEVHTDDTETAKQFFPNFPIYQNIQLNWEAVRYSQHLILANSAFGIIPAMLNGNVKEVIAPRRWARRNLGKDWSMPSNFYRKFSYIWNILLAALTMI